MPSRYDEAVTELYQAPLAGFVAERKRLAAGLKAAGDKEGAAKLGKLGRPPASAWAVNQLWWHNRRDMEAMLETAERLRAGDLGAAPAHREAIAKLRARASAILQKAGHGATEATLRRVTTTLSAIAAAGGFEPDRPGTLTDDRDPPGFETMALGAAAHHAKAEEAEEETGEAAEETGEAAEAEEEEAAEKTAARARHEQHEKPTAAERRREAAEEKHHRAAEEARERAEEARRRAEAAAEKRRLEQQTARKKAQRERALAALRTANGEVERLKRDLDKLRAQVTHAEDRLVRAKEIAADLEGKLAELK